MRGRGPHAKAAPSKASAYTSQTTVPGATPAPAILVVLVLVFFLLLVLFLVVLVLFLVLVFLFLVVFIVVQLVDLKLSDRSSTSESHTVRTPHPAAAALPRSRAVLGTLVFLVGVLPGARTALSALLTSGTAGNEARPATRCGARSRSRSRSRSGFRLMSRFGARSKTRSSQSTGTGRDTGSPRKRAQLLCVQIRAGRTASVSGGAVVRAALDAFPAVASALRPLVDMLVRLDAPPARLVVVVLLLFVEWLQGQTPPRQRRRLSVPLRAGCATISPAARARPDGSGLFADSGGPDPDRSQL